MKFENIKVYNFEGAFRGMRNPKNSWDKSDSCFGLFSCNDNALLDEVASAWMSQIYPGWENMEVDEEFGKIISWLLDNGVLNFTCLYDSMDIYEGAFIGPKDMRLAQELIKGGSEHRKFLRQIFVTVDITAPLYWWKEADTYKVGTVANSTSTMHKLVSKPITLECFEIDDYSNNLIIEDTIDDFGDTKTHVQYNVGDFVEKSTQDIEFYREETLIGFLEQLRQKFNETKDKRYWKELVRWLPESWLQTRTWTANYEILRNIYFQRKNHKLTEWSVSFINFIESLPYSNELIMLE